MTIGLKTTCCSEPVYLASVPEYLQLSLILVHGVLATIEFQQTVSANCNQANLIKLLYNPIS